jgi:hypothetical protein
VQPWRNALKQCWDGAAGDDQGLLMIGITPPLSPMITFREHSGGLMEKRLIELALEALEARKAAVEKEIAGLKAELAAPVAKPTEESAKPRRGMSAAARKAVSARMKGYWAKRRADRAAAMKGTNAAK